MSGEPGELLMGHCVIKGDYKRSQTAEEIREFTKGQLAAYKYPRQIEI